MSCLPSEYISLTISHKEDVHRWWALCPFHDDHHPSLSINKGGNYPGWFRCWSCGEQGSPARFSHLTGQTHFSDHQKRTSRAISDFYASKKRKKNSYTKSSEKINFAHKASTYQIAIQNHQIDDLSAQLGVSSESLIRLGVGFGDETYTIPMKDAGGNIIGIRRRLPNGKKLCLRGSRSGLFYPEEKSSNQTVLICEGESDTAAALTLGFSAVGRPGCSQCLAMLCDWCDQHRISEAIIVADNDPNGIGQKGAKELLKEVVNVVIMAKIIIPPAPFKDLRDWLKGGATREDIITAVNQAEAHHQPRITSRWVPHRTYRGPFKPITVSFGEAIP